MTRILLSETPVTSASKTRTMCGTWVADHMVICSPVGSHDGRARLHERRHQPLLAEAPLDHHAVDPGLGDGLVDVLPVPAAAESKTHVAFLFVPRSAWTRSAPSSIAASMSSTAGSSS